MLFVGILVCLLATVSVDLRVNRINALLQSLIPARGRLIRQTLNIYSHWLAIWLSKMLANKPKCWQTNQNAIQGVS